MVPRVVWAACRMNKADSICTSYSIHFCFFFSIFFVEGIWVGFMSNAHNTSPLLHYAVIPLPPPPPQILKRTWLHKLELSAKRIENDTNERPKLVFTGATIFISYAFTKHRNIQPATPQHSFTWPLFFTFAYLPTPCGSSFGGNWLADKGQAGRFFATTYVNRFVYAMYNPCDCPEIPRCPTLPPPSLKLRPRPTRHYAAWRWRARPPHTRRQLLKTNHPSLANRSIESARTLPHQAMARSRSSTSPFLKA